MAPSPSRLEQLLRSIDIPDDAYEKTDARYKDLYEWLTRPTSTCRQFSPHVYPQGSFRLGTVVRPLSDRVEYDLDLGCRLRRGISKITHTQKQLKELVGSELAAYRAARQIKEPLEEKTRCWRLRYADQLAFHMDVVPSIPESDERRVLLRETLRSSGIPSGLSADIAGLAGSITDNRLRTYSVLSPDWKVSNSEGYALWFESRVRLGDRFLTERARSLGQSSIDALPARRWKAPLQAAIQLLKRHRDVMYHAKPASQPISIIITTLAARAYQGEVTVDAALATILDGMDRQVSPGVPRVPNPVNPAEDFADKWHDQAFAKLRLEEEFRHWLASARAAFQAFAAATSPTQVVEQAGSSFRVPFVASLLQAPEAGTLTFPPSPIKPSKPAGFA